MIWFDQLLAPNSSLIYWVGIVLPVIVPVMAVIILWRVEKHRLSRQSDLGPTCEQCGYLLIGLKEPRCPECGMPFIPPGTDSPQA